MKNSIFIVLLVVAAILGAVDGPILRVDVKAGEAEGVIKVSTRMGIATAFEFPASEKIRDMILGDPKFWVAESNGRVGVVRQLKPGVKTSLFIFTNRDVLYTFLLGEDDAEGVVKVKIENTGAEKIFEGEQRINEITAEKGKEEERRQRANYSYKIKDKHYKIDACFDDGIITTIQLDPKTQIKPAVFLSREKDKLEQVKYTEEDGVYKVHYVLQKNEYFILKEGKKVSVIGV